MSQLFVDDAYKAFRIFEKLAEKQEFGSPMQVHRVRIGYEGPPAFAIYKNTGKKAKSGGFVFKKLELVFERQAS